MLAYYLLKSFYLYSIALWSGSAFFATLFATPAAFKVFSKEEAGKYTEYLLGKYFLLGIIFSILAITTFYLLERNDFSLISALNTLLLLIAGLLNFLNGIFVYPKASKLKVAYYETKDKNVYNSFLKLHKISLILNSLVLLCLWMILGITSLFLTF